MASIVNQGLTFTIGIILARLLSPSDFGKIAMIGVFVGFISIFKDIGFSTALVQKREIKELDKSSVFWSNVGIGISLGLMLYFVAPLIAMFYQDKDLEILVQALSIPFVLNSSTSVHNALLVRKLAFNRLAVITIIGPVLSGATSILLAIWGFGVWSLVIKSIIASLLSLILHWTLCNWRPRFVFELESLKQLMNFSLNLTGTQILNYWANKLDDLLVGKFMGDITLGLYSKAYGFLLLPVRLIKSQFSSILFPLFSSLQDDYEKQRNLYLKFTSALCLLFFPLVIGLYATTDEFVQLLLGKKWLEITPLIKIFCVASLFQAIGFPGILYMSNGETRLQFRLAVITRLLRVSFIFIGIFTGNILLLTICVSSVLIINLVIMNYKAIKIIELTVIDQLKAILPSLLLSLAMLLILIVLRYNLSSLSLSLRFLLLVFSGLFSYIILLIIFKPHPYSFLLNMAKKKLLNFS